MQHGDEAEVPKGAVPLSEAIEALRAELMRAFMSGADESLRFEAAPVELTLQTAVTWGGRADVGIKWWLISAGGEISRQSVTTQTVKLTLKPRLFDAAGNSVEFLIDTVDGQTTRPSTDIPTDAVG
ncbi:trypco2 family protein [Kribbella endophytica]